VATVCKPKALAKRPTHLALAGRLEGQVRNSKSLSCKSVIWGDVEAGEICTMPLGIVTLVADRNGHAAGQGAHNGDDLI